MIDIQFEISRYSNPIKSAFIKGLLYDISIKNPYLKINQKGKRYKVPTFSHAFFKAFEHGRMIKIKYNILTQLTLF